MSCDEGGLQLGQRARHTEHVHPNSPLQGLQSRSFKLGPAMRLLITPRRGGGRSPWTGHAVSLQTSGSHAAAMQQQQHQQRQAPMQHQEHRFGAMPAAGRSVNARASR